MSENENEHKLPGIPISAATGANLRAAREGLERSAALGNTITVEGPIKIRIDNPDGVVLTNTIVLTERGMYLQGNGKGSVYIGLSNELTWDELVDVVAHFLPPAEAEKEIIR